LVGIISLLQLSLMDHRSDLVACDVFIMPWTETMTLWGTNYYFGCSGYEKCLV
jgi:hypothetical protein